MGLLSSIGNLFSGAASGIGNFVKPVMNMFSQPTVSNAASNLMNMFGGGNKSQGSSFSPSNFLGSSLSGMVGGNNPKNTIKSSLGNLLDSLFSSGNAYASTNKPQTSSDILSSFLSGGGKLPNQNVNFGPKQLVQSNAWNVGGQKTPTAVASVPPVPQPKYQQIDWGSLLKAATVDPSLLGPAKESQNFKGMLPGIATMLMSRFIQNPSAPKLPGSVQDLQSRMRQPINPAAMQAMNNMITQPFQPMNEAEIQAALQQLNQEEEDALNAHRDVYKNIRPGSDPLTDSTMAKDEALIRDKFARAKADTIAGRTRDLQNIHTQNVLNATKMATGLSEQEIQNEVEAANYDIEEIMNKFNMDYADAVKLRDAVLEMGSKMTLSNFGVGTGTQLPNNIYLS